MIGNSSMKYVVIRGLKFNNKFYSINDPQRDETKLANGEVAYEILGYADTDEDALRIIFPGGKQEMDLDIMNYLRRIHNNIIEAEFKGLNNY